MNKCKVCGQLLGERPLLKYKNMPAVAQHLPDKHSLQDDRGVNLMIYQCLGCGLVQLGNEPVSYYKEVIRAVAVSPEMREFRMKQFSDFVNKYALKRKKIIEIGCGRGEYLSILFQTGVKAHGMEYSGDSIKQCIKNGLDVQAGFIKDENSKIEGAPFDAFFMLSFLEHLPNPKETLRGIGNNLKDGAVGLVEVPNFDMIFRKKLFSEFTTDHLLYFTKDTLETALALSGFSVVECDEVWHDYIISAVIKKKAALDMSDFYLHQEKIASEIRKYVRRLKGKKLVVWGAGHQSLAAISLFGLADKIKYVVDSALFKQGKYTPTTHLPIVSPDEFFTDSVDAIIIMAGSYSDEIKRIIREESNKNIKMAILRDSGLEIVRR